MPSAGLLGASSRLERALRLNDTCSMRYQKTELSAYGTFSLGAASPTSVTVDVTGLVGFASSNTTVGTIMDPTSDVYSPVLQGLVPGTTAVSVVLSELNHPSVSLVDAAALVEVSRDVPAVVEDLTVVVFTGMSWSGSVGSVSLEGEGSAGVTLKHELSAEGDTASVAIYANFDDGTYEDVTGEAALSSLRPSSLRVIAEDDNGPKGLEVEVGVCGLRPPAKLCALRTREKLAPQASGRLGAMTLIAFHLEPVYPEGY